MDNTSFINVIRVAYIDVMSMILGIDVSNSLEVIDSEIETQISGVMLLLGNKKKMATISISEENAKEIVSYMVGIDPSDLSKEEVYDGVAELVNMILGRVKLFLKDTEDYFDLTPPFTVIGDTHKFIIKEKLIEFSNVFSLEGMDASITVFTID